MQQIGMMRPQVLLGIIFVLFFGQFASAHTSYCNEVWVDAEDIFVERDDTAYFYFPIYNDADQAFTVREAIVYRQDGDFDIEIVDYPDEIEAGDEGELTIRVDTDNLDNESLGEAYVKVRGWFEDETYCGFGEVETVYFDVTVETGTGDSDCDDIEIRASNVSIGEDRTETVTFTIRNRSNEDFDLQDIDLAENSSYFDAWIYSKPSTIRDNDSETFRVRIESNRVSRDRQGTATLEAKGRFDDGSYCNYSSIEEENFTVYVEEDSGIDHGDGFVGGCRDIYLNAGTVRVEQGSTSYRTVYLENDADEDFLIDFVSVFDSSGDIKAEENGYEKVVPANGSSYINVKIQAYDYAETGEEEAFLEVKGHFQGEQDCEPFGDGITTLSVIVEEEDIGQGSTGTDFAGTCTYFSLIAPEAKTIDTSGTIEITIDNRTMERATVRLSGPGLTVQPQLISVPKYTLVTETVSVASVLSNTSLVYEIEALGCNQSKTTGIIATGIEQEKPAIGQDQTTEENGEKQAIQAIEALGVGFASLGSAGALIGLLALVAIAIYVIFKP